MDGYVEALKSSHFTEVFVDIGIIPKGSFFQGEGLWPAGLEETTLIPSGVLCAKLTREGYRICTLIHRRILLERSLLMNILYFLPSSPGLILAVVGPSA